MAYSISCPPFPLIVNDDRQQNLAVNYDYCFIRRSQEALDEAVAAAEAALGGQAGGDGGGAAGEETAGGEDARGAGEAAVGQAVPVHVGDAHLLGHGAADLALHRLRHGNGDSAGDEQSEHEHDLPTHKTINAIANTTRNITTATRYTDIHMDIVTQQQRRRPYKHFFPNKPLLLIHSSPTVTAQWESEGDVRFVPWRTHLHVGM